MKKSKNKKPKRKRLKKFNQIWSNQTNLGKNFGISAIEIGKILSKNNLKSGKVATKKALQEGYAKSTPLKNGTQHFMWNITKVEPLITSKYDQLSQVDYHVNEVLIYLKEADILLEKGNDKLGYIMYDFAYDDVPKNIRQEVKKKVEEILREKIT